MSGVQRRGDTQSKLSAVKYKTKSALRVPAAIQNPARSKEGLYTPDSLKWGVRGAIKNFFSRHKTGSFKVALGKGGEAYEHSVTLKECKPDWLNDSLHSHKAAGLYPIIDRNDPFFMSEVPDGPWAVLFELHKEIWSLMEVEFDLIKERVRVKLSPKHFWITPIHTSVYQALEERVMKIISTGGEPEQLAKAFLPHVASVTFFIYKDKEIVA